MSRISVFLQAPNDGVTNLAIRLHGDCIKQNELLNRIEQVFEFALPSMAEKFADSVRYFPEVFSANQIPDDATSYVCPIGYAISVSNLCKCSMETIWKCEQRCTDWRKEAIAERVA